ncbi:MAG TPA: phosphatidylglycerophosphatase A [Thermoanaerobaculia bacterium]
MSTSEEGPRAAFRRHPLSAILATGFGSGLSPFAPGTAGSLVALVLAWLLSRCIGPFSAPSVAAGVGLLASGLMWGLAGVPAATRVARVLRAKDPGAIVVDEFAGQFLASAPIPMFRPFSPAGEWAVWIASFLLFRLFDIWKPGFIRKIQDWPEGWGIVVDDLAAGVAAAIVLATLLSIVRVR